MNRFAWPRWNSASLLTPGGQLLLLFIGLRAQTPWAWRLSLTLVAMLSLAAWILCLRRVRAFADTPTSSVASAAQGYVELRGLGKPLGGAPVLSPLTNLPCLWYRYQVDRRDRDKWVRESSGESDASFLLEDGTGTCAVDPDGAEIVPTRCETWLDDDRRYTQWAILENDPIEVIGLFRTLGAGEFDLSVAEEVKQLLADWKADRPRLLQRFDLNRDGELDMHEWELARTQAQREVEQQRQERRLSDKDCHLMGKPNDGRLYLISTVSQDKLGLRYRLWAWAHAVIFLGALIGFANIKGLPLSD